METTIRFTVRGEPQGKGRPRIVRNGAFSRAYTPETTVLYENLIKLEYQRYCKDVCFMEGCVGMAITAYFSIPKTTSKRKRALMIDGQIYPVKKPDCDNVAKCVCDALNGLAYKDDSQISDLRIVKRYAEIPKIVVDIWGIKEEQP
ncbi:MAG: RusA family crossover junction endodeoxyribonuclease [Clostridia bacterium]